MVMLNGKTYLPSSYVGSPRFTQMEKTARSTFSDGEKYPTTKEVRTGGKGPNNQWAHAEYIENPVNK